MWMGIAKAVEEISAESFARKEKEKDRELRKQETLEERQFRLDMMRQEAAQRQKELMTQLRIKRAAAGLDAENHTAYTKALAGVIGEAEGADEYMTNVAKDPRVAKAILDTVQERQAALGRPLSPQEIVDNIKPIISEGETSILDLSKDFDTEYERLLYETEVQTRKRAEPGVLTEGELFRDYDKADIELAETAFTNTLIDVATTRLESMEETAEKSKLLGTIQEARKGESFAMADLLKEFGPQVASDFVSLSQSRPEIAPIFQSPTYGRYMRGVMEAPEATASEERTTNYSTDQYEKDLAEVRELYTAGLLNEEQIEQLRKLYPGEFE